MMVMLKYTIEDFKNWNRQGIQVNLYIYSSHKHGQDCPYLFPRINTTRSFGSRLTALLTVHSFRRPYSADFKIFRGMTTTTGYYIANKGLLQLRWSFTITNDSSSSYHLLETNCSLSRSIRCRDLCSRFQEIKRHLIFSPPCIYI